MPRCGGLTGITPETPASHPSCGGGVAGAGVALDEAPGVRETLQPRPPSARATLQTFAETKQLPDASGLIDSIRRYETDVLRDASWHRP